jgi:hypothetical protein
MLQEDLIERLVDRGVPAKWSGGFTLTNAREQVEWETDVELLRKIRRRF